MDDVQSLVSAAKEESYLFVVDSRGRDTGVYPTPSEHAIQFSSPFRNVFGLDLLDATVARTEYLVDDTTNRLSFAVGHPASAAQWALGAWPGAAAKRTLAMQPGDYTLPQFVQHLNAKLAEVAEAHGEPAVSCYADSTPSDVTNKLVFTCSAPFTLFMDQASTLRHTLGFGDPVRTAASPDYAVVPGWTVNADLGAAHAFLSVPASNLPNVDPQPATQGPVPSASREGFLEVRAGQAVRQRFVAAVQGPVATVYVYAFGTLACPDVTVTVTRAGDGAVMATGSLAAAAVLANDFNDINEPLAVTMTTVGDGGGVLQAGDAYWVQFSAAGSPPPGEHVGVYHNADNLPVSGERYVELVPGGEAVPGQNLCCDVVCASWGHAVRSPGIVNLTGPRYVSIRCPEIESHMFRDRVNEKCHAGLGMVQLRGYGFREQRFDFVSFPPRRFHPLGKLSKLTFRLERPDGTLYNSNGVDHALLLVLRYYSLPHQALDGPRPPSMLNPAYVPDLRHHLINDKWRHEARAIDRIAKRY